MRAPGLVTPPPITTRCLAHSLNHEPDQVVSHAPFPQRLPCGNHLTHLCANTLEGLTEVLCKRPLEPKGASAFEIKLTPGGALGSTWEASD